MTDEQRAMAAAMAGPATPTDERRQRAMKAFAEGVPVELEAGGAWVELRVATWNEVMNRLDIRAGEAFAASVDDAVHKCLDATRQPFVP